MNPREQRCQTAFKGYLARVAGAEGVWEYEPNGQATPPDFRLQHPVGSFAVEVTTVMTQYKAPDGSRFPDLSVLKAAERLVDSVEREAKNLGILHGGYLLALAGSYALYQDAMSELKKSLLKKIEDTRNDTPPPLFELGPEKTTPSGLRYHFDKFGNGEDLIALSKFGDREEWDHVVLAEMLFVVQRMIADKHKKLRGVPDPWVLLIADEIGSATPREYQAVREQLAEPGGPAVPPSFTAVYIIDRGSEVHPLHPASGCPFAVLPRP